jgi:WD40 repeat protein
MGEADDDAPLRLEVGFKGNAQKFALSSGADRVAVVSTTQVASWNLGAEAPAETRVELPKHEGYVMALAVSENGRRIATSMLDGPVRLWDPEDLSNPVALPMQEGTPMLLAFLDGDRRLMTADQNGSLAAWDLDIQSLVARARRLAGRELTPEEGARFLSL